MLRARSTPLASLTRRMLSGGAGASALVVAEHDGKTLGAATASAVAAAKELGGDVSVLVAGSDAGAIAEEASQLDGVGKVLHADDAALAAGLAENLTAVVTKVAESGGFTHVIGAATNFGKNFIPRVAVKLDVAAVTDVVDIVDGDTFVRPIYAGNALATVKSSDSVKVMTVRPTNFDAVAATGGAGAVEAVDASGCDTGLSSFVSEELTVSDRPALDAADIVVAGGRGMKNGENFAMLESLADALGGAAVGASRAAVDAGFVPNDMQIGQTGKVVAPKLYIGVGVSGAIQHLAGMKDSKTIVVINKDAEAPFFQVADYGLVADLFDAVPELEAALKA